MCHRLRVDRFGAGHVQRSSLPHDAPLRMRPTSAALTGIKTTPELRALFRFVHRLATMAVTIVVTFHEVISLMSKDKHPTTNAVRVLREHGVAFTHHPYTYEPRGGTEVSARELGVDEHAVVKTLIMEDDAKRPLIVLMHGDREVSTKALARLLKVKSVQPCVPTVADRHSGYQVGGTSPFGTRRPMPVYVERSIATLPCIYINGGHRGYLVGMPPAELLRVLAPTLVDVAVTDTP